MRPSRRPNVPVWMSTVTLTASGSLKRLKATRKATPCFRELHESFKLHSCRIDISPYDSRQVKRPDLSTFAWHRQRQPGFESQQEARTGFVMAGVEFAFAGQAWSLEGSKLGSEIDCVVAAEPRAGSFPAPPARKVGPQSGCVDSTTSRSASLLTPSTSRCVTWLIGVSECPKGVWKTYIKSTSSTGIAISKGWAMAFRSLITSPSSSLTVHLSDLYTLLGPDLLPDLIMLP